MRTIKQLKPGIIVLLVAVLVFCLAACGNQNSSSQPPEEEAAYENNEVASEEDSEEAADEEPEDTRELKGILYINRDNNFVEDPYDSQDIIQYVGGVNIYSLDPETGVSTMVRSFNYEPFDHFQDGAQPWIIFNWGFDENYERLAIDTTASDGSSHVGWIDEAGNYTDVTELTMGEQSDFSGLPYQVKGTFGPDGYFYYYEKDNQPYRVPIDNLTPDAVEKVDQYLQLYPDGTVYCAQAGDIAGEQYTDASLSQRLDTYWPLGTWLKDDSFVELDNYSYNKYTIHKVHGDGSKEDFIPDVDDRWNYNPVASPDGSQVAFLSSIRTNSTGVDHSAYVFVVPSKGGDPKKVSDDLSFICRTVSFCYLLEWR